MPNLQTPMHLEMHRTLTGKRKFSKRLAAAIKMVAGSGYVYGMEWGDPDGNPPLVYIRDQFVIPYAKPDSVGLEIGAGGGRWTKYLITMKKLYAVDFHQELLDELTKNFASPKIVCVRNNGNDFPGIPDQSIDFLFSFGCFVHLDADIIEAYLRNMKRLLKPTSEVVIQYSDKTKPLGRDNPGFSENDPERMRKLVSSFGYTIREEDTKTLWHSAVIRFGLPNKS
jgi:SAM-dependent methyltransferase